MQSNMHFGASHYLFKRAEALRLSMTPAESIVWNYLSANSLNIKFRRQHPIETFIADFYCHSIKLAIEIDGDIHSDEDVKKYDEQRENYLIALGLTILRIKNEEVFKNFPSVISTIQAKVTELTQNSLLGVGGNQSAIGADVEKKQQLTIIKIGGNIIDDEQKLSHFLQTFSEIEGKKILVHGGGKLATRIAEAMGIQQQMVEGRRITNAETLKIVTMVYAGYINKNIVSQLQGYGCNAIGLSGADGNAILAHKRTGSSTDYGFAGDVDAINTELLQLLLDKHVTIVLAPVTHNGQGQLLNTNADTIAQETAKAFSHLYKVNLVYAFEKPGVLLDVTNDNSTIPVLSPDYYQQLKSEQKIFAGMIPKLDNAFAALQSGVHKVIIGQAEQLQKLLKGETGTTITNE